MKGGIETSTTLHMMTSGIDEGFILDQNGIPLFFEDTWDDVFRRNDLAINLTISRNLTTILDCKWIGYPQNKKDAGYSRRGNRSDGYFSWDQPIYHIYNLTRGLVNLLPRARFIDNKGIEIGIRSIIHCKVVAHIRDGSNSL